MKNKVKETILLQPKKNCRDCLGRGWLYIILPNQPQNEVRPCYCVKAKTKERPEPDTVAYQQIVRLDI